MAISLDNILGIHEEALKLRAKRGEVLASNMANADTPNFKAKDIDFKQVLSDYAAGGSSGLMTTNNRHIGGGTGAAGAEPLYRVPLQASVDGNTVEADVEKSKFMENALRYQASLSFIDGRLRSLMSAIKGE